MSELAPEDYRNHEPDQQGIWFEYTGYRYKDLYDIRLQNGKEYAMMRPNGNGWYGAPLKITDEDVSHVRLKLDSELEEEWYATGQDRIDHQINLFGTKEQYLNKVKNRSLI